MSGLLALAFTAGMVAPINPCGFALLPAWTTLQVERNARVTSTAAQRLPAALRSGVALAVGFSGTLLVVGLIVSAGARPIIQAAPALGIAMGLLLVVLGVAMLAGLNLSLPRIPGLSAIADGGRVVPSLAYGVGFATVSLACTFGVLLAVIAQAQATATFAGMLAVFAAYAAGSAAVLIIVAVAAALVGTGLQKPLARIARHTHRVVAAILIATGAYLAWYWYPAATGKTPNANRIARLAATLSGWVEGHDILLAVGAAGIAIAIAGSAAASRARTTRSRN